MRTPAGLAFLATPLPDPSEPVDTVVLPGGGGVDAARSNQELVSWIKAVAGNARRELEKKSGRKVTAEVRSVNGRFFKLSVKIPGRYGALEERIKALLNELGIKRGSVDANLFFEDGSDEGGVFCHGLCPGGQYG